MTRPRRSSRAATAVVAVSSVTALGLPLAPAQADDIYWVPVGGRLDLHGHGFGHGHGMSQYGAEGAARLGKTWREIVGFYYPGTDVGENAGPVRVLVTADTTSDVIVRPATGLAVTDLADSADWTLPTRSGIDAWRLTPTPADGAVTSVQYHDGQGWHRWEVPGRTTLRGDGQLGAAGPVSLVLPSGSAVRYRGALRAASPYPGAGVRDTVNVVPMDDYVRGVVPYEMPASWSQQALRSQAVAARTYASYAQRLRASAYYQICDTTACQVYGGASAEQASTNEAVTRTAGKILTYGGRPAFTQFSASSGGWTSDGGQPYLIARADSWDDWSGNAVHDWDAGIDVAQLENSYPQLGRLSRIKVTQREGHGQWGGRIEQAVLVGTSERVAVTGDTLRWAYGLRSTWFAAEPTPIIAAWQRLEGTAESIGRPTAAETAVANSGGLSGALQSFARGRMLWSPRTGAHPVSGAILADWAASGGAESRAGFPVGSPSATSDGRGRKQAFQRGMYLEPPGDDAHHLFGPILRAYLRRHASAGALGYPVTKVYDIDTGRRARFQHGRITWTRATQTITVEVD